MKGGSREGAGRKRLGINRKPKSYRLKPSIIEEIARKGGSSYIEELVERELSGSGGNSAVPAKTPR